MRRLHLGAGLAAMAIALSGCTSVGAGPDTLGVSALETLKLHQAVTC